MTDMELQKWLDGAMTEGEAEAFLASLPQSERREAEAFAALTGAATRLPAAEPSEDFAARAMARVRARRPPRRSVWTWLRAPTLSPLAALAGAVVIAVGAFGVAQWRTVGPGGRASVAGAPSPAAVVARLAYRAPLARQVAVAGNFNGWKPEAARMQRGQGGVWTVEIPLVPGRRYEYMFLVDGHWVTDPSAAVTVDDGFGGLNAVLDL